MITIVLTNRNRDLNTIKNCLDSLEKQSNQDFELFFVDYGSNEDYVLELEQIISKYSQLQFIKCPVSGQLWNKCRAINIALNKSAMPYFFVGDIDMLFHPDFVSTLYQLKNENVVTYFQVGFLSKNETLLNKDFFNSKVDFTSQKETTGMTLYPTELLKKINGYDEFYHGWGAEDTDVHLRLRNLEITVNFYDKGVFLKHQWHPKTYRTNQSSDPYHFMLEKINHSYIKVAENNKTVKANTHKPWGVMPEIALYAKLSGVLDCNIQIESEKTKLIGLLAQFSNFEDRSISVLVKDVPRKDKIKQFIKKILGRKHKTFLSMKTINDMILFEIVSNYRNSPYHYFFDQNRNEIYLKIHLSQ